jgi:hypothetical protein
MSYGTSRLHKTIGERLSEPSHPVWKLLRVVVICGALLTMQLLTATNYDLAIDGEAGTLAGVAALMLFQEFRRS